jgi:hypothetical protein
VITLPYVLSTATCPQKFCEYAPAVPGAPLRPVRSVTLRGGANAPSAKSGFGEMTNMDSGQPIWTPSGVSTKVTDEEVKLLLANETFLLCQSKGFYKIVDGDPSDSHAKIKEIAKDMTARDNSAPLNKETAKTQIKVSTKLTPVDE